MKADAMTTMFLAIIPQTGGIKLNLIVRPFDISYTRMKDVIFVKLNMDYDAMIKKLKENGFEFPKSERYNIFVMATDDPTPASATDQVSLGYFRYLFFMKNMKRIGKMIFKGNAKDAQTNILLSMR